MVPFAGKFADKLANQAKPMTITAYSSFLDLLQQTGRGTWMKYQSFSAYEMG